jgi:hypothetical protein
MVHFSHTEYYAYVLPKLHAACAVHAKTFGSSGDGDDEAVGVSGAVSENQGEMVGANSTFVASPSSSASSSPSSLSSSSIYSHEPAPGSILPSFIPSASSSSAATPSHSPAIESPFRCLPASLTSLMREAAAAEYVLSQAR